MKIINKMLTNSFLTISLLISIATTVHAGDDTDIYFPIETNTTSANVLFIMDVSGSMRREVGNTGNNRYEAMKDAFNAILQTTPEGVNVGLMNFGSIGSERTNFAQGVKFPISPLVATARDVIVQGLPLNNDGSVNWNANNIPEPATGVTVFDFLPQVVESWSPQGYTPLVGSLYEAGLYYRGEKVGWGSGPLEENGNEWVAHPSTYTGAPGGWDATACATVWTERLPEGAIPTEYRCPSIATNDPRSYATTAGTYANCAETATDCIAAPGGGGGGGNSEPITIGNTSHGEDGGSSITITHNLASGENRVVVVGTAIERDNAASVSSITYGGENMTPVAGSKVTEDAGGYTMTTQLFYLMESDLPNDGNHYIEISHNGNEIIAGAVTLTNVDQSGPAVVGTDIYPGGLETTIPTTIDNAVLVDIVGGGDDFSDGDLNAATQQIQHWYEESDSSQGGMSTRIVGSSGSYDMSWDWDDNNGHTLNRGSQSVAAFIPASSSSSNTVDITINSGSDDAEEYDDGDMGRFDNDLDLGDYLVGLRFTGVNIPQDATITNAYIQFSVKNSSGDSGSTQFTIQGEASDDPVTFSNNDDDISDRTTTTASVTWTPEDWPNPAERGVDQRTSDLSPIIQEVVERSGWNSGQAMVFIFSKGDRDRDAESYDEDSAEAPTLHIEYTTPLGDGITTGNSATGEGNSGFTYTHILESGNNRMVVAGVAIESNPVVASANDISVTYGGTSMNPISGSLSTIQSGTGMSVQLFYLADANLPADGSHNVQIYHTGGGHISSGIMTLFNVNQAVPSNAATNGVTNQSSISTDITTVSENALIVDIVGGGHSFNSGHFNNEAQQTSKWVANGNSMQSEGSARLAGSADTYSMGWNWANQGSSLNRAAQAVAVFEYDGGSNGSGNGGSGNGNNIAICHIPPDNPDNAHTIIIPVTDLPLHEAHGDLPGACGTGISSAGSAQGSCLYTMCSGAAVSEPTYISPIGSVCQSNTIILLSDGSPQAGSSVDVNATFDKVVTNDEWTSPLAEAFRGLTCANISGLPRGKCGPELTNFLATDDNSDDHDGDQHVQTYTVGLGLGQNSDAENYLKALATVDDPNTTGVVEGYYSASDTSTLITAFSTILAELQVIEETTTAFSNPGYSIVSRTGLNHEDTLFVPVFEVGNNAVWKGNLKKFKTVDISGKRRIQGKEDANGARHNAVTESGALTEEAHDLWSTSNTPEGRDVVAGGAAALLDPASRNLYSDLTCTSNASCNLYDASNALAITNMSTISSSLLGLNNGNGNDSLEDRKNLICFIRGYEGYDANSNACTGAARKHMGDMLHFAPIGVTYHYNHEDGDNDTHRQVIFAGTNEGYLHAIDTETGEEIFAFMPKELLKNIKPQFDDNERRGHRFGIDGIATVWISDHNENGIIEPAITATGSTSAYPADKVYLYFGLRRGGNTYYALDVTDPTEPKLKWKIEGGGNGNFQHLGQSWSRPYLALLNKEETDGSGNTTTQQLEVAIFSGGYDAENQDKALADRDASDSVGNDIFIVNANTGEFIWSIKKGTGSATVDGSSALTHSVPGGVRIIDMDKDGAIDRMYFADVTGKVWRLELAADLDASILVPFADIGGGSSGVEPRKFFNEPDVSLTRKDGNVSLLVSIGSGDRTDPLGKETTDRFYVFVDKVIRGARSASDKIEEDDLAAIEIGINEEGARTLSDPLSGESILHSNNSSKKGWYLEFTGGGEKVIADSLTNRGKVIFNTLVPDIYANAAPTITTCNVPAVQGRAYILDILEGKAGYDFNGSGGDPDNEDLYSVISANEIPGGVQLIFNAPVASDGSDCTEGDCVQNVDLRTGKKLSQIMSYNAGVLESVYWTKPQEK